MSLPYHCSSLEPFIPIAMCLLLSYLEQISQHDCAHPNLCVFPQPASIAPVCVMVAQQGAPII